LSAILLRILLLSIRGRFVRWIRMLRQPKYLVGFVVGVAYVGFWITHSAFQNRGPFFAGRGAAFGGDLAPLLQVILATVLAGFVSQAWLLPWGRLGLPFREAELMMLLPAPLTRRQIISFALLKSQSAILTSSLLISLFAGSGRLVEQARLVLGIWLTLTLLDLNNKGRALFLIRQREIAPLAAWARRLVVIALVVGFWTWLGWVVRRAVYPAVVSMLQGRGNLPDVAVALEQSVRSGAGRVLLTPFLWLTGLPRADDWRGFFAALAPLLVVLVVAREAVVRSKASFEESALQHARSMASRRSPGRRFARLSESARLKGPFVLRPTGKPELAILWKNLMLLSRAPWTWWVSGSILVLLGVALLPAVLDPPGFVLAIVGAFGWIFALFLPLFLSLGLRNDFRSDLAHLDLVRTWPVEERGLSAAEILGPAVVATAAGCFGGALFIAALVGAHLQAAFHGASSVVVFPVGTTLLGMTGLGAIVFLAVGILPVLAGATAMISATKNLAILAFPAWVGIGPDAGRGFSVLGHRMLLGSVMIVGLAVGLVPGALVVGVALLGQWALGVPWSAVEFPLWGALAAGPLFVEVWLLVQAAGRLWSKLDPTTEILELGR
jgi:hypothetical protein